MVTYFVEVTDTYGGEANYCWAHHFKVEAKTERGAVRKVRREMELGSSRCVMDAGDMQRWDIKGAAICMFVEWYDETRHGLDKYAKQRDL
jgi:hypothetical protein